MVNKRYNELMNILMESVYGIYDRKDEAKYESGQSPEVKRDIRNSRSGKGTLTRGEAHKLKRGHKKKTQGSPETRIPASKQTPLQKSIGGNITKETLKYNLMKSRQARKASNFKNESYQNISEGESMSTYKDKLLNLTSDYLISEAKADKGLTPLQKKLARGGRFHRPYKETGMSRRVSHILNKRYTKKDQETFEKERDAAGQKPKGKYEKGRFKYTSLKGITHAEKDKLAAMKKARAERLKAEMPDSKPPYKNESSIQEVVNPKVKAQRKAISKRVKGSGMVPKYSRLSPETVDHGGEGDAPSIGLHSTYQGGDTKHQEYKGKSGTNEKPPRYRKGDYDTKYIGGHRGVKKSRGVGGTPEGREGGIKIGDYLKKKYQSPRKYIKGTHPAVHTKRK